MNTILKLLLTSCIFSCALFGMEERADPKKIEAPDPKRIPFIIKICKTALIRDKLSMLQTAQGLLEPFISYFKDNPEFLSDQKDVITTLYQEVRSAALHGKSMKELAEATDRLRDEPSDAHLKIVLDLLSPLKQQFLEGTLPFEDSENVKKILVNDLGVMHAIYLFEQNKDHENDKEILRLLALILDGYIADALTEEQVKALSLKTDVLYSILKDTSCEDLEVISELKKELAVALEPLLHQDYDIAVKFAALVRLYSLSDKNEHYKIKLQNQVKSVAFFDAFIKGLVDDFETLKKPAKNELERMRIITGTRLDVMLGIIAGHGEVQSGIGMMIFGKIDDLVPLLLDKNHEMLKLNIIYRLLCRAEKLKSNSEWIEKPLFDLLEPSLDSIRGSKSALEKINEQFAKLRLHLENRSPEKVALGKINNLFDRFHQYQDEKSLQAVASYLEPLKKRYEEGEIGQENRATWEEIFGRMSLIKVQFLLKDKPSKKRDRKIITELNSICARVVPEKLDSDMIKALDCRNDFLKGCKRMLSKKEAAILQEGTRLLASQDESFSIKFEALKLLHVSDDPDDKLLCNQLLRSEKLCEMVLQQIHDQLLPLVSVARAGCRVDIPQLCTPFECIIMMIEGGRVHAELGVLLLDTLLPLLNSIKKGDFYRFQLEALNLIVDRARQLLNSEYSHLIPCVYEFIAPRIKNLISMKESSILQRLLAARFEVLGALISGADDQIIKAQKALKQFENAVKRKKSINQEDKLHLKYMVTLLQQAWLLGAQGKTTKAQVIFEQIINNTKDNHKQRAYQEFAFFLAKQGNYKKAIEAVDKALALIDYKKQPNLKIILYAQRGSINYAWDKREARVDFERVYLTPRLNGYYEWLTKLRLAELYQQEDSPIQSIELCQQVAVNGDKLFALQAYAQLAELYYNEGDFKLAIQQAKNVLDKCNEKNKLYFKSLAILGCSLCGQKKYRQSAEYLMPLEDELHQLDERWKTNVACELLGFYITKLQFHQAGLFFEKMQREKIDCEQASIAINHAILLIDSSPKQSLKILNRIINSKASEPNRARAAYYAHVCYQKLNQNVKAEAMYKLFLKKSSGLEISDRALLDRIAYEYLIHPKEHLKPQEITMCKSMLKQCTPRTMDELDKEALDQFHRSDCVMHYATIFKKLDMIEPEEENELARGHLIGVDQKFSNLKDYSEHIYQISMGHTDGQIEGYKKQSAELQKASLKKRVRVNKMNFINLLALVGRRCSQEDACNQIMEAARTLPYDDFCVTTKTLGIRLAGREL